MPSQEMKISLDRIILPNNRLLVREIPPETASPGGIIIPDISRQDRRIATVIKMGSISCPRGEPFAANQPSLVEVGDEVLTSRVAMSSQVAYELGEGLHIIDVRDMLAVVKPEKYSAKVETVSWAEGERAYQERLVEKHARLDPLTP